MLETIELESSRLGRLVGDLLDLSRLEAGAAPPETEAWDLADLVREAVGLPRRRAERVEVAGETPVVEVDGGQLQRAIANLVENALKFSPPGVAGARADHGHAARRRSSAWSTRGRDSIRASSSASSIRSTGASGDRRSGAGLGLAIARGFVEANGGRVWAESRPGQGATFAVALPVSPCRSGWLA